MIKDRKFLTGITLGLVMGASVMAMQPTNAAGEDGKLTAVMNGMAKVMIQIVTNQKATNAELAEIKTELKALHTTNKQILKTNAPGFERQP